MPLSHPSSNSVSSNDTDRGDEHKLLSERGRELSRNINLEDELEREERMEILGAVSGVMEKKTIDGDQLAELEKSLFKKYSDQAKETTPHPYVSLSTRVKDILPHIFMLSRKKNGNF